jgi:hypothetical protein
VPSILVKSSAGCTDLAGSGMCGSDKVATPMITGHALAVALHAVRLLRKMRTPSRSNASREDLRRHVVETAQHPQCALE